MKTSRHQQVARRKRRIERRLRARTWPAQPRPMYGASDSQYEHSDRVRGLTSGGIGAMHGLTRHTGLSMRWIGSWRSGKWPCRIRIGSRAGIAYDELYSGTCMQDIERLRQDEVYLDALRGGDPKPTTAGHFCRRFDEPVIEALQAAMNETRVRVGARAGRLFRRSDHRRRWDVDEDDRGVESGDGYCV